MCCVDVVVLEYLLCGVVVVVVWGCYVAWLNRGKTVGTRRDRDGVVCKVFTLKSKLQGVLRTVGVNYHPLNSPLLPAAVFLVVLF